MASSRGPIAMAALLTAAIPITGWHRAGARGQRSLHGRLAQLLAASGMKLLADAGARVVLRLWGRGRAADLEPGLADTHGPSLPYKVGEYPDRGEDRLARSSIALAAVGDRPLPRRFK